MTTKTADVIDEVVRDHEKIKRLFARVEASSGTSRDRAFDELVRTLIVHETAEQEVVHPLADRESAKTIAEARRAEERKGERLLDALVEMGTDNPKFDEAFGRLRDAVLAHAENEENEEHPRIRERTDAETLSTLATLFRAAEATAPTRPHPGGPTSAAGNLTVGPLLSIVDRTRDAIREARKKAG